MEVISEGIGGGGVALSGLFSGGELLLFGSGSPVNY